MKPLEQQSIDKKVETWIVSYYINGEPFSLSFPSLILAQLKYQELIASNIAPTIQKVIYH